MIIKRNQFEVNIPDSTLKNAIYLAEFKGVLTPIHLLFSDIVKSLRCFPLESKETKETKPVIEEVVRNYRLILNETPKALIDGDYINIAISRALGEM